MRGYTQLTRDERYQIYALRKAGHSQKEIAEVLRRNPSTISRELGRNKGLKGYRPEQAHRLAQNRKKERDRTRIPESTWARVEQLLREDWSPEQISGWLTREEGVSVSHERIYQHVYEDKRRGGDLHRHLRCQKPRRKRYGHYDRRGQIRERVSIDERPEVVEARSRIGDWEADTVIGKLGGAVLVTLVERRSRLSLIALAPNKTSLLRMSEVVDTDSQALHHLLTEAGVDWDGLSGEVARQADALLGDEQAALILDESAFAKKGTASAGVARMWNGRLGKVDNSQVGVFSALCRDQRVTLLDTRLYLPKDWVEDAERCRRAHIPEEARQLRSKCELALELVDSARQHGVRFGYVAVDGGYGKDPAFLRGLETRSLCFLADVHKHQRIWLDDPAPYRPATTSRGRPASIRRTDRPALTVAEWAAQQPVSAWKRIKLRQGEKGTLKAEYLHARVWAWDRKEETARHWHLLVRRECGADTPSHFVFSNADASTSISRLARMHGCRFFIEHAFREAKSELAMADYQVRRWDAWHRHMALVMRSKHYIDDNTPAKPMPTDVGTLKSRGFFIAWRQA